MATDPYKTLGVKRDATADQIRAAYRKLAKTLHPDLNPGDKKAEERFKTLTAAYDLLGDPDKRARFDRGEIDGAGAERPRQPFHRDVQGAHGHAFRGARAYEDFGPFSDLFGDVLGGRGAGGPQGAGFQSRGMDTRHALTIDFLDAINGASRRVTLAEGTTLDLTIPPGTEDGQTLRLRGKGASGFGGGPAGDALITISVRAHPYFIRKGDTIEMELPVTLAEAVMGARLDVPTPKGPVRMTVPKGSNTGTRLRLKGKGVARAGAAPGDEYVTLRIVLPEGHDAALEDFVRGWAGAAYNPRAGLEP